MDDRLYYAPPDPEVPAQPAVKAPRKAPARSPQAIVSSFWSQFDTKHPGKVFNVLPKNHHAKEKAAKLTAHGTVHGQKAAKSYEQAKAECVRDVDRIIRESKRTNQKYRDPHFDIEWDLKAGERNCLDGLVASQISTTMKPKGVKRVTDIFEKPDFYINGPSAGDVRQGRDGDCYLMAALCGLGNMKGLIEKVCVKHDAECVKVGVYGFVFYRDGEWQQTIIDDKLYLRAPDYDEAVNEREVWDDINRVDGEEEYRRAHQTGSRALYFAQCSDENETWLPLLEKAYAKAHGDFAAIDGGFVGEAIEDLTGGVTVEIYSTDILDKEAFWHDELMQVGKTFLFGCATGFYSSWLDTSPEPPPKERQGISEGHAYSIMDAKEIKDQRLLKVRNPWGKKEWYGKWSDGSAEWDAEWMQLLGHKFGNDGVFWISYEDLLRKYQHFDRTRIFGPEWSVSQCWTSVDVAWAEEYHATKFKVTLTEKANVVIVLSQLDSNYFKGLEGPYRFDLQFRLEDASNADPDDYIVRANEAYAMTRSVSTDIELDAGTYWVLMKITATRQPDQEPIEDVLPNYAEVRRDKLIQMGLSYDLAHAKGVYIESREEKEESKKSDKERRKEEREKVKKQARKEAEKRWKKDKMRHDRMVEARKKAEKKRGGTMPLPNGDDSNKADGSLYVQAPGSSKSTDPQAQQNGQTENELPVRIKSFSGESIPLPAPTPTDTTQDSKPNGTTIDNLVQPLDEVINPPPEPPSNATQPALTPTTQPPPKEKPPTPIVEVNGVPAITDVRPLPSQPPRSEPEHTISPLPPLRTDTAGSYTTAPVSTGPNDAFPPSSPGGSPRKEDDTMSIDSFASFDWNSELDLPSTYASSSSSDQDSDTDSSDSSDDDAEHEILYRPRVQDHRRTKPPPPPPPGAPEAAPAEGQGDDQGAQEPWNAVCVVGLRVYSTIEGGVDLKVVWPKEEPKKKGGKAGEAEGAGVGKEGEENLKLDPDDQAKGAVSALQEGGAGEGVRG